MCAVCGVGLDAIDGRPAHVRDTIVAADHVAVPVPYASLPMNFECDFCGALHPQSAAPTFWVVIHTPFAVAMLGGPDSNLMTYDSPWLACATCTPAVKAHDWNRVIDEHPLSQEGGVDPEVRQMLLMLYKAVEANLTEERPWKPEDLNR